MLGLLFSCLAGGDAGRAGGAAGPGVSLHSGVFNIYHLHIEMIFVHPGNRAFPYSFMSYNLTMDLDLLSGILAEPNPSHQRQLLPNLPNSLLTYQNAASSHPNPTSGPITRNSPGAVISKIEDIFEAMTDCILDEKKELVIQLKTRDRKTSRSDETEATKTRKKSENRTIRFPSKSPQEAWKFSRFELRTGTSMGAYFDSAALLRILELSHEALVTGIVTTKRFPFFLLDFFTFISSGLFVSPHQRVKFVLLVLHQLPMTIC